MTRLNPNELFERLANDIPSSLHGNLIVAGSLAAAYEFKAQLEGQAISTKDIDVIEPIKYLKP